MATVSVSTQQTEAVLDHHLNAISAMDLDGVLADYADDCVLFTQQGPLRGLDAIRAFFTEMTANLPPGFMDSFTMTRKDVVGDTAYIVWASGETVPLGTDTFIVRDDKIVSQTVVMYMPGQE